MTQYVEISQSGPVLSPKRKELNEVFLASYSAHSYDGCEFGCPYCDGWAWSDTPLDSCIRAAIDRPDRIAYELREIPFGEAIGLTHGEPYQPIEARYRITRQILQVAAEQHRPIIIATKSPAVCEDIPILKVIHRKTFAVVAITIVTLDARLSNHLEGQIPSPDDRLKALGRLKQAGIPCGFALIPIFPFLTDKGAFLKKMFERFQRVKPDFIVWDSLWIHKGRHKDLIQELLFSLDCNLVDRYERLYQNAEQPSAQYRQKMDKRLFDLCLQYGFAPRIPEHVYEQTLSLEVLVELRRRNRRFMSQINWLTC